MIATTIFQSLADNGVPVAEKVLRTIAVYFAIVFLLRLFGKRELAQLNSFDLVVLLLLSNVVQNALIGPDNTLVGGLVGAVTLLALNAVVVRYAKRNDRFAALFESDRSRQTDRSTRADVNSAHATDPRSNCGHDSWCAFDSDQGYGRQTRPTPV